MSDVERVTPSQIAEGLDTDVLGRKQIVCCQEIDSTNARARELADRGAPEGVLVVAERQIRGRGRKGRTWFSPPGAGIYASLVLIPSMSPSEAPRLTFLTAVAAAEALMHETGLDVRIKWPNDLLVRGKKIAGILTEINTEKGALEYAVVGLGMNVNAEAFPDDIKEKATSALIETGRRFSRTKILREYLKQEEKGLKRLDALGFAPILGRWKELADTIGRRIRVEMPDKTYEGWVEDVDPEGVLILRGDEGPFRRIVSGDVTFL
jgi:BirA family transcriptional regulator, biotin operon repressor / biotin---[acetyl-CoA-carboxylase] ligase